MAGYRFFPAADRQQDEIWRTTCEKWGEAQAEKYIRGLHDHIQNLADRVMPWYPLPGSLAVPADLKIEVFFSHYERHYLFFRELSDGSIGIMNILHDAMDIPVRLGEELRKINQEDDADI